MGADNFKGILDEPKALTPEQVAAATVKKFVLELDEKEARMAELEKELMLLGLELKELKEVKLPEYIHTLGTNEFNVPDFGKVTVKQDYYTNIAEADYPDFKSWARAQKYADVLNEQFILYNLDDKEKAAIEVLGHKFEVKNKIAWQRLRKFARELAVDQIAFPPSLKAVPFWATTFKKAKPKGKK